MLGHGVRWFATVLPSDKKLCALAESGEIAETIAGVLRFAMVCAGLLCLAMGCDVRELQQAEVNQCKPSQTRANRAKP